MSAPSCAPWPKPRPTHTTPAPAILPQACGVGAAKYHHFEDEEVKHREMKKPTVPWLASSVG